uniref:Putative aminopeptidase W07G4.4 n=1 Tax=Bemisia tabaci TaxID=7038 RepID=A0A7S5LJV3_BEMTA|nr:putative aminopeptidase W07G4.4 [Bemisia tabaci]
MTLDGKPGKTDFIPSVNNKLPYEIILEDNLQSESYNGIILISRVSSTCSVVKELESLNNVLDVAVEIDRTVDDQGGVFQTTLPSRRLVYSPVGTLGDYDDVRSFHEAAAHGIKRALSAGVTKPLLILPQHPDFPKCQLVSLLGALSALYSGIQFREHEPNKFPKLTKLAIFNPSTSPEIKGIVETAKALESARWVARDIGVGDPERMTPAAAEAYVQQVFDKSNVEIRVVSDVDELQKEYPLFAAVNRGASGVERHRGRVVWLKYKPKSGEVKRSIVLVGKGVTFDTGGVDVKINGASVGMSRDKCGAAAVAGFMQLVSILAPADVEIIGALCLVRNSIGSNAYTADEVIVSRAGKRVRIGNTDAEGRMAMADVLCEAKELASCLPDPHLYTIATLTGHAWLYAQCYSIVMCNGPAREGKINSQLVESGQKIGDPFESSTLQREDFSSHKESHEYSEILQAHSKPSVQTCRGHQGPAAFLIMASGLQEHGLKAETPLKYSHLDIAGSAGDFPHDPTGAPILALAENYLL